MGRILALALALLTTGLATGAASAATERRVALVIGNSAYAHTAPLKNPRNDASELGAKLTGLGFEVVSGLDLGREAMVARIQEFSAKLNGADVGLVYYAGHGLQFDGENWLVPVDAQLSSASDVEFQNISLGHVLKQLERQVRVGLVFIDACRDNPMAQQLARSLPSGTRSGQVGRGLARVDNAAGMFIAFATQPGNVAQDGSDQNSPFSKALITHISTENASISDIMIKVRNDVMAATAGKQVPWENSSLTGQFYFRPPVPAVAAASGGDAALAEIEKIKKELEELKKAAAGSAGAPTGDAVAALAPPSTVDRTVGPEVSNAPSEADQGRPGTLNADLVTDIQSELQRLSCYSGLVDGAWGDGTTAALQAFSDVSGLPVATDAPADDTLKALKTYTGASCPLTETGPGTAEGESVTPGPTPRVKPTKPAFKPKRSTPAYVAPKPAPKAKKSTAKVTVPPAPKATKAPKVVKPKEEVKPKYLKPGDKVVVKRAGKKRRIPTCESIGITMPGGFDGKVVQRKLGNCI